MAHYFRRLHPLYRMYLLETMNHLSERSLINRWRITR
jgi:hypothetical protein